MVGRLFWHLVLLNVVLSPLARRGLEVEEVGNVNQSILFIVVMLIRLIRRV